MARRSAVLLTALVAMAFAIGVPSASASVEFGDNCTANTAAPKLRWSSWRRREHFRSTPRRVE